MKNTCVFVL